MSVVAARDAHRRGRGVAAVAARDRDLRAGVDDPVHHAGDRVPRARRRWSRPSWRPGGRAGCSPGCARRSATRAGFVAIWLQWIQNVVWYPTQIAFIAASLSFVIGDQRLANNGLYTAVVILVLYWGSTLITLAGGNLFAKVGSWSGILGTLLPAHPAHHLRCDLARHRRAVGDVARGVRRDPALDRHRVDRADRVQRPGVRGHGGQRRARERPEEPRSRLPPVDRASRPC